MANREYMTKKYRVVKGWFMRPVLQVWCEPPNIDYWGWRNVSFQDCHSLIASLEGKIAIHQSILDSHSVCPRDFHYGAIKATQDAIDIIRQYEVEQLTKSPEIVSNDAVSNADETYKPTPDNPCGHTLGLHDVCKRCGMLGAAEYLDKQQRGEISARSEEVQEEQPDPVGDAYAKGYADGYKAKAIASERE